MKIAWNERYGTEEFFYGTEPNDFLREKARHLPPGGRVLCLGEGEGRNAVFLASSGLAVTAVDGAAVGLAKMERLARSKGVEVQAVVADLNDYVIEPQAWDGIVSIWCHLPSALRKKVHRAAVAGLRPGGVVILEAYRPQQLEFKTGGPPDVDFLMSLEDLRAEFEGLDFSVARETVREVQEGLGHRGQSAVVQIVAKKNPGAQR